MRRRSDDVSEMTGQKLLDDATAEAVLRGTDVPPELEPLAGAVRTLRGSVERPVQPRADLATRMATGSFATASTKNRNRLASISLRTKVAATIATGLTGLTTATAAGAIPDDAQERIQSVIEAVTPIEFSRSPQVPGPGKLLPPSPTPSGSPAEADGEPAVDQHERGEPASLHQEHPKRADVPRQASPATPEGHGNGPKNLPGKGDSRAGDDDSPDGKTTPGKARSGSSKASSAGAGSREEAEPSGNRKRAHEGNQKRRHEGNQKRANQKASDASNNRPPQSSNPEEGGPPRNHRKAPMAGR